MAALLSIKNLADNARFFWCALTDIKLKSYGTAFLYSTGDSGNLPMKKLKILMHINIFSLHKKLLYF